MKVTSTRQRQRGAVMLAALGLPFGASACAVVSEVGRGAPWLRHTIDDSSRGADGVRLADIDGDGRPDITTAWEEGGVVRVYLNPGPAAARDEWPAVTVGRVGAPEDAVFVDVDGDGAIDVVSSSEGRVRTMWVHWAPADRGRLLDAEAWTTEALGPSADARQWMFCLPLEVDGQRGIDLVAGAKGSEARIGWFQSPRVPRDLSAWTWHSLYEAGWIMSLIAADMDGDGDADVLASDRKGPGRGTLWLENPGPGPRQLSPWVVHRVGGEDREVMFITRADLDGDGMDDVVAATRGDELLFHRRTGEDEWTTRSIALPPETGTGKAVRVADIDLDGWPDIVFTCENAKEKSGVMWMSAVGSATSGLWRGHEISGTEGTKFDRIELLDLDADGDLDVITCEEREGLGVIWYENPTRSP